MTWEEIRGDDGLTVSSLVVRFTLPESVTNADGLELLLSRESDLHAVLVHGRSAWALSVTMPVQRDPPMFASSPMTQTCTAP